MKNKEPLNPAQLKAEDGYNFKQPERIPKYIENPDSVALWNNVMRRVVKKDENGKEQTVLNAPDTASQVFSRAILRFWDDEEHIREKFDGFRPTAKELYEDAGLSKSAWGRIMSGELLDLEKGNVFAIALALRLNEEETAELLYAAGFAINYEHDLDAAVMYLIRNEMYEKEINWAILGEFCNLKNGLDNFTFRPITEKQMPVK